MYSDIFSICERHFSLKINKTVLKMKDLIDNDQQEKKLVKPCAFHRHDGLNNFYASENSPW